MPTFLKTPKRVISSEYLVGLFLLLTLQVHADSPVSTASSVDVQQSAYRDSIAQEDIKKQTDLVHSEIQKLIAQLKENGMATDDIQQLNIISSNLYHLSQEDMQKVIVTLQNVSIDSQQQSRQENLVAAYSAQKNLSTQLKGLAVQLSTQQNKVAEELQTLIVRQSANVRLTSSLPVTAPDKLNKDQAASHQVATSEQNSIGSELSTLFSSLEAASNQNNQDPAQVIAQNVYQVMGQNKIVNTSQTAADLTKAGPFPEAVNSQKNVLDSLATLLKTALAQQDTLTRLRQAKNQLDQVIADQKDLSQATKEGKLDPTTLAQRQAEVNDRAELAKQLLKPLNASTADKVDQTQKKMDQIASDLQKAASPDKTSAEQDDALKALQDADKQLDQQVADAEAKQKESPTDKLADLQKLQDEIKQAEQKALTNPQDTAKDLQQIQQDARSQDTDAANKLADAADKLANQQPDLNGAQNDMAAASADLQKQQDQIAQDAQDFKALSDANQALEQAKQAAQQADKSLQSNSSNLTDAARQLSQAQSAAQQVAQNSPQGSESAAQQAAQQASEALKNSLNQAVQANRGAASSSAQQGIQQLQNAQNSLAQTMSQMQQKFSQKMQALNQQNSAMAQSGMMATMQPSPNGNQSIPDGKSAGGGSGLVMGTLSKKDREALTQYQGQKTPAEYTTQVQQYLKNLADYGSKN